MVLSAGYGFLLLLMSLWVLGLSAGSGAVGKHNNDRHHLRRNHVVNGKKNEAVKKVARTIHLKHLDDDDHDDAGGDDGDFYYYDDDGYYYDDDGYYYEDDDGYYYDDGDCYEDDDGYYYDDDNNYDDE